MNIKTDEIPLQNDDAEIDDSILFQTESKQDNAEKDSKEISAEDQLETAESENIENTTDTESDPQKVSELEGMYAELIIEMVDKTSSEKTEPDDLPLELTRPDDIDLKKINGTINDKNFDAELLLDFFTPKELSSLVLSGAIQLHLGYYNKKLIKPDEAVKLAVKFVEESIREENIMAHFDKESSERNFEESIYARSKRLAIQKALESKED